MGDGLRLLRRLAEGRRLEAAAGGQVDFVEQFQGEQTLTDLSWHISDHYPLWVEFAVPAQ
ncbi:hypothetical protein ACIF83_36135 [Streptomyces sp. NPDC085866]|uniref:hypothetical protein n=1 Tax=Streptomyces sp. NPDC085866 TaxID=3365736 RepID=UPI0037CF2FD1